MSTWLTSQRNRTRRSTCYLTLFTFIMPYCLALYTGYTKTMHCVALRVASFKSDITNATSLHDAHDTSSLFLSLFPSSTFTFISLAAHVYCGAALHRLSACPICALCQSKLVLGHGENVSTGKCGGCGEVHIILVTLVSKAQAQHSTRLWLMARFVFVAFAFAVFLMRHAACGSTATLR